MGINRILKNLDYNIKDKYDNKIVDNKLIFDSSNINISSLLKTHKQY